MDYNDLDGLTTPGAGLTGGTSANDEETDISATSLPPRLSEQPQTPQNPITGDLEPSAETVGDAFVPGDGLTAKYVLRSVISYLELIAFKASVWA